MVTRTSTYSIPTLSFVLAVKLLVFLGTIILAWHLSTLPAGATPPISNEGQPGAVTTGGVFSATVSITGTASLATAPADQGICATPQAETAPAQPAFLMRELVSRATRLAGSWLPGSTLSERTNILLLGSDSRPGEKYGHTDTIILVTIDPVAKTAGMLSIPRDLWVTIPGYGENRINYAYRLGEVKKYPGGGVALLRETIEADLGIPIHFYGLIEFEGFKQGVDILGGIDLCVPETIDTATIYGYLPTSYDKLAHYSYVPGIKDSYLEHSLGFDETLGHKFFYIEAGSQTLDGEAALNYAQTRATVTADFARARRQQEVLLAIRRKALQIGIIPKIPELWEMMGQMVKTDLALADVVQLARLAYEIDLAQIRTETIGLDQTIDYKTPSGAQVLLPDQEKIEALITDMFGLPQPEAPLTQAEFEANIRAIWQ